MHVLGSILWQNFIQAHNGDYSYAFLYSIVTLWLTLSLYDIWFQPHSTFTISSGGYFVLWRYQASLKQQNNFPCCMLFFNFWVEQVCQAIHVQRMVYCLYTCSIDSLMELLCHVWCTNTMYMVLIWPLVYATFPGNSREFPGKDLNFPFPGKKKSRENCNH